MVIGIDTRAFPGSAQMCGGILEGCTTSPAGRRLIDEKGQMELMRLMEEAFAKFLGNQQRTHDPGFCPQSPVPFSTGRNFSLNANPGQDQLNRVREALPRLDEASRLFGAPAITDGSLRTVGAQAFGTVARSFTAEELAVPDQLLSQAQDLLKPGPKGEPPSQANVVLAGQLFSSADLMCKTFIKINEMRAEAAKAALQAARA